MIEKLGIQTTSNEKKFDHIILTQGVLKQMTGRRFYAHMCFLSDHICVVANISTTYARKKTYKPNKEKTSNSIKPKTDLSQFDNEKVTNSFIAEVEKLLITGKYLQLIYDTLETSTIQHQKASSIEMRLTKAMEEAAASAISKKLKVKQHTHKIFKDDPIISYGIERRSKAKESSNAKTDLTKL